MGSPAEPENPFVFNQSKPKPNPTQTPQPGAGKPESTSLPTASKKELPDFAAMAAAVPRSMPTAGLPDFSAIDIKSRPTAESKASVSPQAVTDSVKPSSLKASPEEKSEKAAKAEKPQPADTKKPSSAADELAGFREFAAIAGAASAGLEVAANVGSSSVAAKPEMRSEPSSATDESVTAAKSGSAKSRERLTRSGNVFGQAWLPVTADVTALLLFATAIYQAYGILIDAVSVVAGISIIVALTAAGVAMLMLSLAVRLISQISVSLSQSKWESIPRQI